MIVISSCLSSCNNQISSPTVDIPDVGVTVQHGKYLDISVPQGWNSLKTSDPISLMIVNVSNNQITSRDDFHSRIFVLTNNRWLEVSNTIIYAGNQIALEPNKEMDIDKTVGLIVAPDLRDTTKSYQVRIFVFGSTANSDQTKEELADYIDVNLSP